MALLKTTAVSGRKLLKKKIGCRQFYYPSGNKEAARKFFGFVKTQWQAVRAMARAWSRKAEWTPETLARIEAFKLGIEADPTPQTQSLPVPPQSLPEPPQFSPPPITPPAPQPSQQGNRTLYQVVDEFLTHCERRRDAKQINPDRFRMLQSNLKFLKRLMPDQQMNGIGYDQLNNLALTAAARPLRLNKKGQSIGRPVSVATVVAAQAIWRAFFGWAAESEAIGWTPPKKPLVKILNLKPSQTSAEERTEAEGVPIFTVPELCELYSRADKRLRLYMLLALNTGATQKEIATLKRWEIHLDAPEPYIERIRNKTKRKGKILGRWILWAETADLLRRHLEPANPEDLALLTPEGHPLVRDETDTDTVANAWTAIHNSPASVLRLLVTRALLKDHPQASRSEVHQMYRRQKTQLLAKYEDQLPTFPPVRRLGFKTLRKVAHQMARRIGGVEVAETLTQHADGKMARLYSGRDFSKVAETLRTMRQQLQPMFDAAPPGL